MVAIALLAYATLAFLRPRLALGALLFLVPFGHLVRFEIAEVPFTFPEMAIYVFTAVVVAKHFWASFRASSEKSHTVLSIQGMRSLGSGLGMTKWGKTLWIILPLLWVLVAAIAAIGSPAGERAWGIWKAYFFAPVLLFWIVRHLFQWNSAPSNTGSGNDKCQNPNVKSNPNAQMTNVQHFLLLTSYVLLPIAASAFIVAAVAIAQWWWPIGVPYPWSLPGKFRATSVFGYPNAIGLYLAPLVPLLIGAAWSLRGAGIPRHSGQAPQSRESCTNTGIATSRFARLAMTIVFGCTAIASSIAIALARSTGALVALAVALPIGAVCGWYARHHTQKLLTADYTYFHDRENRCSRRAVTRWRWAVAVIGVWVMVSLVLTAWLPYRGERHWGSPLVQKLTFQKWSGSVRLAQYRETWQLLRDHPIRGAGLAGYQTAIRPYHEDSRVEIFLYPHNLMLAVWVELGLAGVLVFLAILYAAFRSALVIGHWSLVIVTVVILIHGFVDVPYFKNDLAMVFWVIVAIGTAPTAFGTMRSYGESIAGGLYPSTASNR